MCDHIDEFEFFLIFEIKFRVIFPYLKRGQLPSSRHLAVVIIAPNVDFSRKSTVRNLRVRVETSINVWNHYDMQPNAGAAQTAFLWSRYGPN